LKKQKRNTMKTLNTIQLRNQIINSLINQGLKKEWAGIHANKVIYGLK